MITPKKTVLRYSIVGSSSYDARPCYYEMMSNLSVQEFLLDLAIGDGEIVAEQAAIDFPEARIDDLLALRLIRQESGRLRLNFALFTAEDVRHIREASEHYATSLAGELLSRRAEFEAALAAYDAPGVAKKDIAYFLLGCATLDWAGGFLAVEKGYCKVPEERPDGKYVPAAEEICEQSLEGIYWGSHNASYDGIHLTSFGDHHTQVRCMLPDLLWRTPNFLTTYPDPVKAALKRVAAVSLARNGRQMGQMLLELRNGPQPAKVLQAAAGTDEDETLALLQVLLELNYVAEEQGLYQARIPVLAERDREMVDQIIAIGLQVIENWLENNYSSLRNSLGYLVFMRSGVPFEEGFTMIWHYLFGITNRKLIEAGLFADPYDPLRKHKGAIPAIYNLNLQ